MAHAHVEYLALVPKIKRLACIGTIATPRREKKRADISAFRFLKRLPEQEPGPRSFSDFTCVFRTDSRFELAAIRTAFRLRPGLTLPLRARRLRKMHADIVALTPFDASRS